MELMNKVVAQKRGQIFDSSVVEDEEDMDNESESEEYTD